MPRTVTAGSLVVPAQRCQAFAKSNDLLNAYAGYLNAVSWVCLCIDFLQEVPPGKLISRGACDNGSALNQKSDEDPTCQECDAALQSISLDACTLSRQSA